MDKHGEDIPRNPQLEWLDTMSHQDADSARSLEKKSSKQKTND
jgi:hypothetical protein